MSYFRTLSATLLSAAATFSIVTASGCGTDAVGVEDCRDIEQARCEAGSACLDASGAPLIEDVAACKRFYRDHCLHGLSVKSPGQATVSACVQVIQAAGRCAKDDPNSDLSCTETTSNPHRGFTLACDVFAHPELADECSFLLDSPSTEGSAGEGSGGTSAAPSDESAGQSNGGAGDSAQAGAAP